MMDRFDSEYGQMKQLTWEDDMSGTWIILGVADRRFNIFISIDKLKSIHDQLFTTTKM